GPGARRDPARPAARAGRPPSRGPARAEESPGPLRAARLVEDTDERGRQCPPRPDLPGDPPRHPAPVGAPGGSRRYLRRTTAVLDHLAIGTPALTHGWE